MGFKPKAFLHNIFGEGDTEKRSFKPHCHILFTNAFSILRCVLKVPDILIQPKKVLKCKKVNENEDRMWQLEFKSKTKKEEFSFHAFCLLLLLLFQPQFFRHDDNFII